MGKSLKPLLAAIAIGYLLSLAAFPIILFLLSMTNANNEGAQLTRFFIACIASCSLGNLLFACLLNPFKNPKFLPLYFASPSSILPGYSIS